MISLRQPALALHACDVPDPKYQMKTTWNMPAGASPSNVVYWISYAVDRSPELELPNVVINCHGSPGQLRVGGQTSPSIDITDVGLFAQLRTKDIGTPWLTSCNPATGGDGQLFCSKLATTIGCFVVAAADFQCRELRYGATAPFGTIDNFEGTAYLFSASGSKSVFSVHSPELEGYKCVLKP
jgi:hypothetical protein